MFQNFVSSCILYSTHEWDPCWRKNLNILANRKQIYSKKSRSSLNFLRFAVLVHNWFKYLKYSDLFDFWEVFHIDIYFIEWLHFVVCYLPTHIKHKYFLTPDQPIQRSTIWPGNSKENAPWFSIQSVFSQMYVTSHKIFSTKFSKINTISSKI